MFVIITITFQYEYYYVNRIQQPTNICFVFFSVTSRKPSKGRNMVANNAGEEKIETNANGKMEIIYLMIIFARQFPRLFLSNKAIFIMPDPLRHNDVFHFTMYSYFDGNIKRFICQNYDAVREKFFFSRYMSAVKKMYYVH